MKRLDFEQALETTYMVLQPIVQASDGQVFGHAALVRSQSEILSTPAQLFAAARRLNAVLELERAIRDCVVDVLVEGDAEGPLFVNLDPHSLDDDHLYDPASPLSAYADRVVLEMVHDETALDMTCLGEFLASLRGLSYRVAVDDLGAGYHSLYTFALTNPDFVKFEMAMIRGIDHNPEHAKMLRHTVEICQGLGIPTIGVGVETDAERERLRELGCTLMQGFHFASPERLSHMADTGSESRRSPSTDASVGQVLTV